MTLFRSRPAKIHFVGIGGIGMSGIAEVLLNLGYAVSGSDLKESEITRRLAGAGRPRASSGHAADARPATATWSSSPPRCAGTTPRWSRPARRKIPVIPRAEMLAELMRLKYGVAIAGSHGKTTTTSMVGHRAGRTPASTRPRWSAARSTSFGSNAKLGKGELHGRRGRRVRRLASSSSRRPSRSSPTSTPSTSTTAGRAEALRQGFVDFVNRVPFYGLAVLCLDHPNVQALLPDVEKRYVTYGEAPQADYRADAHRGRRATRSRFDAFRRGEPLGASRWRMVGRHNALNALAVIALADELGVARRRDPRGARRLPRACSGASPCAARRGGVTVVDDYGHHPAEVRATLRGAREAFGRRVVCLFQPHRYTRTRDLLDEFATAFNDADVLLVTDDLRRRRGAHPRRHRRERWPRPSAPAATATSPSLPARASSPPRRGRGCDPGDIVLTLGAGDITPVGPELLAAARGLEAMTW